MLVSEMKEQYFEDMGKDADTAMRVLYSGKELKDDLPLYHYNIKSEMTIIVMYKMT